MNQTISIRKLPIFLWLVTSMVLLHLKGYAQERQITGKIVAMEDSGPLPGATVQVKSKRTSVSANEKGQFTIGANTGDILIFKMIGFQQQEITVGDGSIINVSLKMEHTKLDEVVVVGYGEKKRGDLTGSISSVSGADIVRTQPTTIDQALQGKVPGVVVQQISGQPGGGVSVQIRGLSGFSNNPPLYVIDGVQILPSTGDKGTNPLSSINPSEVASIDILKDASATAIYGAQATNGVVIITTKRGNSGPPQISYDGYAGGQALPKYYDVMNLREYATFMNEKGAIIGYDLRPHFANPQYLGKGTNWQEALFRTALMQNHNLSLSGGDTRTKYYLSGTYFSQDGIALGSDFKRISTRLNLDSKATDWLKTGISLQLANVKENVTTSQTGVIRQALNQTPDVNVINPDGTWGGNDPNIYGATGANPFALASIVKDLKNRYELFGNAYAEIQFAKGLSLRNEVAGNFSTASEDQFDPIYTMGSYSKLSNSANYSSGKNSFYSLTNYLTYWRSFGKYNLNAMIGHESKVWENENVSAGRQNFPSNNVQAISGGDATTATNSGTKGQTAGESYFGRIDFKYEDKYNLTLNIRNDGSSKFAPENRWVTTYSGAFAWRLNQESFLKEVKAINDLKLRIGYGLQNNQNIRDYAYGSTLTTVATSLSGTAQLISANGNPNVKWETTKSYNTGLDASILDRRIQFSVDAYYKKTENLLLSLTLPLYSGMVDATGYAPGSIQSPYINIGSVSNKGIEFSLTTQNLRGKNFNWTSNLTLSHNRNEVLTLNTDAAALYGYAGSTVITKSIVGRSIGEYYGYETLGTYKNAEDFAKYPAIPQKGGLPIPITNGSGGVWVGDVIFKDQNGDGIIDESDQIFLGSPNPKIQFGINNSFNYKNFDLNIFMSGNYGNKLFNQVRVDAENPNQNFGYFRNVLNYARIGLIDPTGLASDINNVYITNPETTITRISQSSGNGNERFSSKYIENGSFLRCKSITLGYSFAENFLSKIHLKSLRLYGQVTNVFTITKYKGYDPEIGSWNPLAAGVDNGYYAQPRVFTIGANISILNK
ncbi:SusC/RagA family TonB-linked outer membrane protein [Pedobacter steynii]